MPHKQSPMGYSRETRIYHGICHGTSHRAAESVEHGLSGRGMRTSFQLTLPTHMFGSFATATVPCGFLAMGSYLRWARIGAFRAALPAHLSPAQRRTSRYPFAGRAAPRGARRVIPAAFDPALYSELDTEVTRKSGFRLLLSLADAARSARGLDRGGRLLIPRRRPAFDDGTGRREVSTSSF